MIFVFKTSVKTKTQANQLKLPIGKVLPNSKWNFDLEDIDKVLRIDSEENVALKIMDLLNNHNHSCEELE